MPLWMGMYRCENCCLVMDRDEDSAVNIYQRFNCRAPATHSALSVDCSWWVDVVAVQFSTGGKLEEIRVYQHAVTADSQ